MRLMIRSITAAAVLGAVTVSNAPAQATAHPNFSGVWVLDASKSVVTGQGVGVPTSATATIVQRGDTITQDREAETPETGVIKSRVVWGLDGKPWKNSVPVSGETTEVTSVLSWEGASLIIRTSLTFQGMDVAQLDRWTMSADGKSLVVFRSINAMDQEVGTTTTTYVKKP